jgi:hypothetical protein
MKVDTKAAREFSEGGDRYTGQEVRLWVHNLADEVDRLRAQLEDATQVLRMADDNNRVDAGEKRKAWAASFVDEEIRRVLGGGGK